MKNQDFSKIILNEKLGFDGKINEQKVDARFLAVSKDPKKPENYLVKGVYTLNGKTLPCSGRLTFNYLFNVKDLPKEMLLFGDFKLNGTQPDIDEGTFKGKFRIQTMTQVFRHSQHRCTTTNAA